MRYKNLEVWQSSVELSVEIYRHFSDCKDYGFKDQITRSSLSVPSNIAEGEERAGLKEQIQFLNIAKGSAGELMTQIIIGEKIGYIDKTTSEQWQHKIMVIAKQLGALMNAKKKTL